MKYLVINTKNYFDENQFLRFLEDFNEYLTKEKIILSCKSSYFNLIKEKSITLCFQSLNDVVFNTNNCNIKYSLVGHRDDRVYKNHTNILINKKIKQVLANGITPILCVGEESYEEDLDKTLSTVFVQIDECLKGLSAESVEKVFIAYEPFWAISDGNNYKEIDYYRIKTIIMGLNKKIKDKYFINPIILYGGSITDKNIKQIDDLEIDGFLIGAACTKKYVLNKIFNSIT